MSRSNKTVERIDRNVGARTGYQAYVQKVYDSLTIYLLVTSAIFFVLSKNLNIYKNISTDDLLFFSIGFVVTIAILSRVVNNIIITSILDFVYKIGMCILFLSLFFVFTHWHRHQFVGTLFLIIAVLFLGMKLWSQNRPFFELKSFLFMGLTGVVLLYGVHVMANTTRREFVFAVMVILLFARRIAYDKNNLKKEYALIFHDYEDELIEQKQTISESDLQRIAWKDASILYSDSVRLVSIIAFFSFLFECVRMR